MRIIKLFIMAAAILSSCNNTEKERQAKPIPIERIDLMVGEYPASVVNTDSLQPGLDLYISLMGLNPTDRDSSLLQLHDSKVTHVFGPDIKRRFTVADSLKYPLGRVMDRLNTRLSKCHIRKIYGIASPYMQSVIVSDSIVFIALNHYLGSDYEGYRSMPDYMTKLKTPSHIPADVAEAVVRLNYPFTPAEGTLLERMLYEGAVTNIVARALGNDAGAALGYDKNEINEANRNLKSAWQAIAAEKLLYSTSPADISRLTDPTPFVKTGETIMPTKAGRFIGLKIIQHYLENNPGADHETLLKKQFYGRSQQRLIESRFDG